MDEESLSDKIVIYKQEPHFVWVNDVKETNKKILERIDDIDLELFLTDIKDKQGDKFELSDELMEIFMIFWEYISPKVKEIIKSEMGGRLTE